MEITQVADAPAGFSWPANPPRAAGRALIFVINAAAVGGAESHAAALAGGLASRGFAPEIFALKRPPEPFSWRRRVGELRTLVQARERPLVVAVNERPALIAALGGLRKHARVTAILHSTVPRNGVERLLRIAHLPALYALDRVLFVSRRQRAYWRRAGFYGRAETILNGVDVRRFAPDATLRANRREALGFAEGEVVAAFCAALRPEKNVGHFLAALAGLRAEGAPLRGLIVGDGPCAARMRDDIARLRLQGAVVCAGMQADVRPWLAAADFGVNCSVAIETLSLSALEMLAMGLPMAMSDTGGAAEIVAEGAGALFRPGDVAALTTAMAGWLDPARRAAAGRAARARALAQFDQTIMFDRYAETFGRLTP